VRSVFLGFDVVYDIRDKKWHGETNYGKLVHVSGQELPS